MRDRNSGRQSDAFVQYAEAQAFGAFLLNTNQLHLSFSCWRRTIRAISFQGKGTLVGLLCIFPSKNRSFESTVHESRFPASWRHQIHLANAFPGTHVSCSAFGSSLIRPSRRGPTGMHSLSCDTSDLDAATQIDGRSKETI